MLSKLNLTQRMLSHETCDLTANPKLTCGDRVFIFAIENEVNTEDFVGTYTGMDADGKSIYIVDGKFMSFQKAILVKYPYIDKLVDKIDIIELNQWVINSQGIFDSMDCPRPECWYDLMLMWYMFRTYGKRFSNTAGWTVI